MIKRILTLLLPQERKRAMKVALAVLFSALLDFISLATLLPVLYYLLDGGSAQRSAALIFCGIAIAVMLIKGIFATVLTRYQQSFLLDLYKRMSFSLYQAYYRKGLLFIREQGVNKMSYEVNFVCYAFGQNILASLLKIISDVLLIALVAIAVFFVDWFTALIMLASFVPFILLYSLGIRKKIREYGRQELDARRKQTRVVAETYSGYAELEVNGAYDSLKDSFQDGLDKISDSRMKMETISRVPMLLSELSVILGLTLLTVLGAGDVKVLLGIFAVAAFRLLPSLRNILSGWTLIQNSMSSLQLIEDGLKDVPEQSEAAEQISFDKELKINNISYNYEDGVPVLKGFSCKLAKGEYVGFSGYSGVGKSTLFNIILGFISPREGAVEIDGKPLTSDNSQSWLKHIGYVQQDVFIFQASLAENIALGAADIDEAKLEKILEQVHLADWVRTLPDGTATTVGEFGSKLSGGQKQRIGIARALYKGASVLLLDEATSSLDNATEKEINDMLASLRKSYDGLTILSIAHRESSLSYCDRIIHLD